MIKRIIFIFIIILLLIINGCSRETWTTESDFRMNNNLIESINLEKPIKGIKIVQEQDMKVVDFLKRVNIFTNIDSSITTEMVIYQNNEDANKDYYATIRNIFRNTEQESKEISLQDKYYISKITTVHEPIRDAPFGTNVYNTATVVILKQNVIIVIKNYKSNTVQEPEQIVQHTEWALKRLKEY